MAPLRRYLKISKHSVVECRIYLDNPSLAQSWLLNPRNPMLPRVMDSVRPLILPKLREEGERGRKKGGKKKVIKDVIVNGRYSSYSCVQLVSKRVFTNYDRRFRGLHVPHRNGYSALDASQAQTTSPR